jgi:hypothetical protein
MAAPGLAGLSDGAGLDRSGDRRPAPLGTSGPGDPGRPGALVPGRAVSRSRDRPGHAAHRRPGRTRAGDTAARPDAGSDPAGSFPSPAADRLGRRQPGRPGPLATGRHHHGQRRRADPGRPADPGRRGPGGVRSRSGLGLRGPGRLGDPGPAVRPTPPGVLGRDRAERRLADLRRGLRFDDRDRRRGPGGGLAPFDLDPCPHHLAGDQRRRGHGAGQPGLAVPRSPARPLRRPCRGPGQRPDRRPAGRRRRPARAPGRGSEAGYGPGPVDRRRRRTAVPDRPRPGAAPCRARRHGAGRPGPGGDRQSPALARPGRHRRGRIHRHPGDRCAPELRARRDQRRAVPAAAGPGHRPRRRRPGRRRPDRRGQSGATTGPRPRPSRPPPC